MIERLPFDLEPDSDIPIRFGHSPAEREELMKERDVEGLTQIIFDHGLDKAALHAATYTDGSFYYEEIEGSIIRKKNTYFFVPEDPLFSDVEFEIDDDRVAAAPENKRRYFVTQKAGKDEDEYSVWVFVSVPPQTKEDFVKEIHEQIIQEYLLYEGITTLHRLGKTINKSVEYRKLALEDLEEAGIRITNCEYM